MVPLESLVLPEVSDVAISVKSSGQGSTPEFCIADFQDTLRTLKLKKSEQENTCVKGNHGYYIMRCACFDLAYGPTVWVRIAAMVMRVSQAATPPRTGGFNV